MEANALDEIPKSFLEDGFAQVISKKTYSRIVNIQSNI